MSEVEVIPCLRVIHEGGACIVVEHPRLRVRFDPERPQEHGECIVHTGLSRHSPVAPPVFDGTSLKTLAYVPPRHRIRRGPRNALAVQLTLPGGGRVLHLGHALHSETPQDWMRDAVESFGGADWLMVGIPEGEGAAVLEHVHRFEAQQLMMMELRTGRKWRRNDREARIAPVVDQARAAGLAAMVVVPQVSVRFELK